MGSVKVPMSDAVERRLPLVSVRSGRPADGYVGVPLGLGPMERMVWSITERSGGRPVARLPLTQQEFDRVIRLRQAQRSGMVNACVFLALGVVLARFPVLLPLGLSIGVLSIGLTVVARYGLARALPVLTFERGAVTLDGVHPDFVSSVERGGRRYS